MNFTEDDESVNELNKHGLKSKKLPPPIYKIFSIREFPQEKKIAVYLPDDTLDDFNFYQGNLIKKLVNDFPNIEFIITRNSGKFFSETNVTCIPFAENMEEIYEQVFAVIRLPIKDATGVTIIETLSMGRIMIASSTDFPYCENITSYEDIKNCVTKIIDTPTIQKEASEFIHKNYDNKKIATKLITIYNDISNE